MFKSGLEEKVSDLLCELGVDYEYEGTSFAYTIQHQYTPDLFYPTELCQKLKDIGDQKIDEKFDK